MARLCHTQKRLERGSKVTDLGSLPDGATQHKTSLKRRITLTESDAPCRAELREQVKPCKKIQSSNTRPGFLYSMARTPLYSMARTPSQGTSSINFYTASVRATPPQFALAALSEYRVPPPVLSLMNNDKQYKLLFFK